MVLNHISNAPFPLTSSHVYEGPDKQSLYDRAYPETDRIHSTTSVYHNFCSRDNTKCVDLLIALYFVVLSHHITDTDSLVRKGKKGITMTLK